MIKIFPLIILQKNKSSSQKLLKPNQLTKLLFPNLLEEQSLSEQVKYQNAKTISYRLYNISPENKINYFYIKINQREIISYVTGLKQSTSLIPYFSYDFTTLKYFNLLNSV